MSLLNLICGRMLEWMKQIPRLPHAIAAPFRRRRNLLVLDIIEAERLDRLRNPSKYLGKS